MLSVNDLEIRVGARTLMSGVSFRVDAGDKVGLVGRNGAGKTTLTKVIAGEKDPTAGTVDLRGVFGYLPQDPRAGDPEELGMTRVLNARNLGDIADRIAACEAQMASGDEETAAKALKRYGRLQDEFETIGGYAAQSEAAVIAHNLGLEDRLLAQPLKTLSGGQRRRIELARILFLQPDTMVLDEPTNHLDHDSVMWLRDFLQSFKGALVVISHDERLIGETVNRVFLLDANRQVIDVYNMGWKRYLQQRAADEERRRRETANAQKKATALQAQAAKFGAKATKAAAAHQMERRAEQLLEGIPDERVADKVAAIRFPEPAPCGRTPLFAKGISKSYGSLEIFTGIDLAIDRGSRVVILGLNGAGKTTLLRILAGVDQPDTGSVELGHGAKIGYYAQEHETLDVDRSILQNMLSSSPDLNPTQARTVLGSFLFSGDDVDKPAGVLSGGEKTRLALAMLVVSKSNVLLLDEPTNNLDPASREQILHALDSYTGAIVLVSHDEGAVRAAHPERVLIMPEATEDLWNDEYADLISLA
ncbi:MAG: ABC-F family ATP-binding cassette domain-containing protein [Pseudoclavibacter sp.]|jgi:ATPase subunit of ABC transporter with duplicated ATPase domains